MFFQARPDPVIECEQPPGSVARLLADLLDRELPKLHGQGPPLIRDVVFGEAGHDGHGAYDTRTLYDEQGIYFRTPVAILEGIAGAWVVRVRGSVWTWDGATYIPNNEIIDVVDIELLPARGGGALVRVLPAFDLGGFGEHVEAMITGGFGGPQIRADSWAARKRKEAAGVPDPEVPPTPVTGLSDQQRHILRLWTDEWLTARKVGAAVGMEPGSVYNEITDLRNLLGEDLVPYHSHRNRKR